ncbi:OmpA family protein [Burkholderia sp. Ac-20379]|uniref:OmpA family protein n=1 Tax=Burkholderia sp. Ac-20379 TaxID=2703900 RepID=UPI00197FC63C|nr:OmpA family protein [Burkholderia sp. Ac-20379]MBN3728760.1 OmpA family protein [Burkholderia sp. Ac-20379]
MSGVREEGRRRGGDRHDTIVKRVVRAHHDDDHGGTWKVAFADFCLALMCLFLVMWVLGARDEESTRAKLDQIERRMESPGSVRFFDGASASLDRAIELDTPVPKAVSHGLQTAGDPGTDADAALTTADDELLELARQIEALGRAEHLERHIDSMMTPFGLRVMLHDTDERGLFERGSAQVAAPFDRLLTEIAGLFRTVGNPLLVIGHTDAVPYRGTDATSRSNWDLSSDRAMSAQRMLRRGGLPAGQILQVIGMGDRAPITRDADDASNRRIELLIVTPAHARMLAAMFGAPRAAAPIAAGVDAVSSQQATDRSLLAAQVARAARAFTEALSRSTAPRSDARSDTRPGPHPAGGQATSPGI